VARPESADGRRRTKLLVMEAYKEHADRTLQNICKEIKSKYGLTDIVILHGIGTFKPGEPVVLVMVSAPRRNVSFKALRESVERYKKEPALFKQEVYEDGSRSWVGA
jgi:molybdopterin synthase catalytic subunit